VSCEINYLYDVDHAIDRAVYAMNVRDYAIDCCVSSFSIVLSNATEIVFDAFLLPIFVLLISTECHCQIHQTLSLFRLLQSALDFVPLE
jgi:hypothetical protein